MSLSTFILCLLSLQLAATGCTQNDTARQRAAVQPKEVLSTPTILATLAADEKADYPVNDPKHMGGASEKQAAAVVVELNKLGRGFAYVARVPGGVHVVHNGVTGKNYEEIAAGSLTLSPDGQRVAYGARSAGKWYTVIDGREIGPFDEKGPPVFSPDGLHIAFEAKRGESWYLHVDDYESPAANSFFEKPLFSRDSKHVVRFENVDEGMKCRLIISDLSFSSPVTYEVQNINFKTDSQQTKLAFTEKDGDKERFRFFSLLNPEKVSVGPSYDSVRNIVFSSDGEHVAYVARKNGKNVIVFDGKEAALPAGENSWPPVIRPDLKGVGVVITDKKGAYIYQAFADNGIRAPRPYKECAEVSYSRDGKSLAYLAIRDERFLIVVNGKEGPLFDRVTAPQFSPDGAFVVYRARKDGKRFVVVSDATGKTVRQHPGYERVFEPVFTPDGKSVAYGVMDSNQLSWKVEKLQ